MNIKTSGCKVPTVPSMQNVSFSEGFLCPGQGPWPSAAAQSLHQSPSCRRSFVPEVKALAGQLGPGSSVPFTSPCLPGIWCSGPLDLAGRRTGLSLQRLSSLSPDQASPLLSQDLEQLDFSCVCLFLWGLISAKLSGSDVPCLPLSQLHLRQAPENVSTQAGNTALLLADRRL